MRLHTASGMGHNVAMPTTKPKPTAARQHRGGPPTKAPGGLGKVLFVRAAPDLLAALDELAARQRKLHPGRSVSRSDTARELLYDALSLQVDLGRGAQGADAGATVATDQQASEPKARRGGR